MTESTCATINFHALNAVVLVAARRDSRDMLLRDAFVGLVAVSQLVSACGVKVDQDNTRDPFQGQAG